MKKNRSDKGGRREKKHPIKGRDEKRNMKNT